MALPPWRVHSVWSGGLPVAVVPPTNSSPQEARGVIHARECYSGWIAISGAFSRAVLRLYAGKRYVRNKKAAVQRRAAVDKPPPYRIRARGQTGDPTVP